MALSFKQLTDTLEQLANLSIIVAIATYLYARSRDKKAEIIQQISFFRKEVIPHNDSFVSKVRVAWGESYSFKTVRLDEPTIEYTRDNSLAEAQEQNKIIKEVKTMQVESEVLNLLEEFSLRLLHYKTIDHSALNCVKKPFVEIVELHAVVLLMQRNIHTGGDTYSSTLKVYSRWKDEVDRRPAMERFTEIVDRLRSR